MKTAIYLEDGTTQIVLTAETEWEKATLAQIEGKELQVFRGGFYHCQGGWVRESAVRYSGMSSLGDSTPPPESLILKVTSTAEAP